MEILKLNRKNIAEMVPKIARIIKEGKVIISPTDTVYGLVADATNKKAVDKIFKIKKRKREEPIPIFVKDIKMAKKMALIDKKQERFLGKVWPGKITTVLKRKKGQKIYGVNRRTIGFRIPNYKLVNSLLRKLNRPLTGTSANISGKPASTKISEVLGQFKNRPSAGFNRRQPDLIIDVGNLPRNRPSKVIDLTGEKVKILRR